MKTVSLLLAILLLSNTAIFADQAAPPPRTTQVQAQETPLESADKGRDSCNVPPKTECETKSSEKGNCHAAQE